MENQQEYEKRFERIEAALAALTMNATAHDAYFNRLEVDMESITAQRKATDAQIAATAMQQAVNSAEITKLGVKITNLGEAVHELYLTCKEQRETVTAIMDSLFKDKGGANPTAS